MKRILDVIWNNRGDTYKRALHTAWQSGGAVFITSILVSVDKIDITDFNAIGALLMSAFVAGVAAALSVLKGYIRGKLN